MELAVSSNDVGSRLDRFLRRRLPYFTQGVIERALRQGAIRAGGLKVKSNYRLESEEIITIQDHIINAALAPKSQEKGPKKPAIGPEQARSRLQKMEITRTADWIAYNKPAGLAVQGGTSTTRHLDGMLLAAFGQSRPRLVHRLDKNTSGLILVARTVSSARQLTEAFREQQISKSYLALVIGDPGNRGICDMAVRKGVEKGHEKMVVDEIEGQPAQTRFLRLEKSAGLSLMALQPVTGRTHQLRIHMAYLDSPILGDGKYGAPPQIGFSRKLHLHAQFMRLPDGNVVSAPLCVASAPHFTDSLHALSWFEAVPDGMPRFSAKKK